MKKITGAGIFIVEFYKNENYIILVKSKNNLYDDAGGTRDINENPAETACRECREETRNLLNFNPSDLSYNIVVKNYISFIVYVTGLSLNYYNHNMTFTSMCPSYWNETDDIIRIPLREINISSLPIVHLGKRTIILRKRTCDIIKILFPMLTKILPSNKNKSSWSLSSHDHSVKLSLKNLHPQINSKNKLKCLNKTVSFHVK